MNEFERLTSTEIGFVVKMDNGKLLRCVECKENLRKNISPCYDCTLNRNDEIVKINGEYLRRCKYFKTCTSPNRPDNKSVIFK